MAPQGIMVIIYMSTLKNTQEIKYVWLAIKINYFDLPAPVGVSYVATQFHVRNSDGRMSKCLKTSQRCEWLIVTSRNVSSKINAKPSKVQIPISFLIIWIFWSNKNELTLHIMTYMSKNHIISKWPNLPRRHIFPWRGSYVLGAQKNRLIETVLLSTHNICFGWEIRKLNFRYTLLTIVLAILQFFADIGQANLNIYQFSLFC